MRYLVRMKNSKQQHTIRGQIMLWLLTIPDEELSDTMLEAKIKFDNDIDYIEFLENNLLEEIEEFIGWNVQMTYRL